MEIKPSQLKDCPRPADDAPPCSTPRMGETARAQVWAFGGGKGGVGKSLVALNVATHLALTGRRVTLVDGDLSGPNLHTLLGVRNPKHTLSCFVDRTVPSLDEVRCATCVPGLQLIPGTRDSLSAAHPRHHQKLRLLRHLANLDADFTILDLGAGTSYPVLDMFNGAHRRAVVLVPEPTSLQNAYVFLKMALFRKILADMGRASAPSDPVRDLVRTAIEGPPPERAQSIRVLVERLEQAALGGHAGLLECVREFQSFLIVNRATPRDGLLLSRHLGNVCRDFLQMETVYAGNVGSDPAMADSVRRMRPFLLDVRKGIRWDELTALREVLETGRCRHTAPSPAGEVAAGLNEDVEAAGVGYHVQTEDRGPAKGTVVTHVFQGGRVVHAEENGYAFFRECFAADMTVQGMVRAQHKRVADLVRSKRITLLRN